MTLHGLDVSHWQSGMNVAATGLDFAIVKATDGTSYNDPQAVTFAHQIINAGMLGGCYHFWQAGQSPTAQADHFLAVVEKVVGRALLVLDWESSDTGNVSGAKAFLDRVYDRTGVRPLIYMSQSVTTAHNWSSVAKDYGLWVARYGSSYGATGAWGHPAMWQYSSSGHVPGYSGNVDLDVFYGDAAAWRAYASGDAAPTPTPDPKEDDMPSWKNLQTSVERPLAADGEWHTLTIAEDDAGVSYSLLTGPKRCSGTLNVSLTGLAKGHEVDLRVIAVDAKTGEPSKIVSTFPATEFFAGSGTTQIGIPFVQDIDAGSGGWARRLRFQIRAFGGEKVTIASARARALYWDR